MNTVQKKEDTHEAAEIKLITKLREVIAYSSQEVTDNGPDLCVRALDAYEASLADENAAWPNYVPLSRQQVHGILFENPSELGYERRENEKIIYLRYRMLLDRIRVEGEKRELLWSFVENFKDEDAVRFKKAEDFADQAHMGMFRDSGEPYIVHPIKVAKIILSMNMDADAIIAGLLHDTIEDNEKITAEIIAEEFSPDIAALVEGVTKLTMASVGGGKMSKERQQSETIRKMFVAMAKDIRVIPIKLCDRLHNMRTLAYCQDEKCKRKARETLEIYAPLAHRLGMGQIKSELEDLAFYYIDSEAYAELDDKLKQFRIERKEFIDKAMAAIVAVMEENQIEGRVNGRPKHLYSIYNKMKSQKLSFDEVYDLMAIRVIVSDIADCYNVLGWIHQMWRPLPLRIKDYISTPKPNGYQSLHTTLIGDYGAPFEVQIRTEQMHKEAEYGIAAHWNYKEGNKKTNELDVVVDWIHQLMDEKIEDSDEFMQVLKYDFFSDYVFVFTPEGDVIDLVAGSTPIDFAYRIHSAIGNRCQGAKVNGKQVPLDYALQMGDIVLIITSNKLTGPRRDWLNIVKTHQARSKIKAWFRKELKEEYIEDGQTKLTSEAKKLGYSLKDILKEEQVPILFKKLSLHSLSDLYAAVGGGSVSVEQVIPRLIEEHKAANEAEAQEKMLEELSERQSTNRKKSDNVDTGIIVKGEKGFLARPAGCCKPLPGDDIVGYITRTHGVSVHRADCPNLKQLRQEYERIIEVSWVPKKDDKSHGNGKFDAKIKLEALERPGLMLDISKLFLSMNMNINALNAQRKGQNDTRITLEFSVRDNKHLDFITKQLAKIEGIHTITR